MNKISCWKKTLAVLFSICVSQGLWAQMNKAERDQLHSYAEQLKIQEQEKRHTLEQYARQNNIPLVLEDESGIHYLSQIVHGKPIYMGDDNLVSAEIVSANRVKNGGGMGLDLTGAGQTMGLWEAGNVPRVTHQEFTNNRALSLEAASVVPDDHASHVAGTIIAAGEDDDARGFSEAASLRCYDASGHVAEMAAEALLPNPIRASNHSYGPRAGWIRNNGVWRWWDGQWQFGAYDSETQAFDNVAFLAPFYLIVKSAGNDRDLNDPVAGQMHFHGNGTMQFTDTHPVDADFNTIPTYGTAKNIITVGAVEDIPGNYTGPLDLALDMSTFSSWGPTDDGRIKPDVVANGVSVYSATSVSDVSYDGTFQGTSMSTPAVTGSVGLLNEHWGNLFPAGPPRAATMKGLLIQQADECGANNGPDYSFGWGLVNVADAAELLTTHRYEGCTQLIEGTVAAGATFSYNIESQGDKPIKVTLVWADPASPTVNNGANDPAGANYLVNNLDLRIDGPSSTFFPWVLDPANPGNAATTGDNNRDNVEQVLLLNPAAGTHTIRVVAPASLTSGPQAFSLLFSGNDADVANQTISLVTFTDAQTYAARQNITAGPAVIVAPLANVRMFAGESISLKPGFHAQAGSHFLAKIVPGGGCNQLADLKSDNYPVGPRPTESLLVRDEQPKSKLVEQPNLSLELSPNPVSDQLRVQYQVLEAAEISIWLTNPLGEIVAMPLRKQRQAPGNQTLDFAVGELAEGIYWCLVLYPNGEKVQKPFVVVH